MSNKGITPRKEDYSQWYLDIIERAELAENSSVRGCMVIKPYGYAIWENIQKNLDQMIKDSGVKNAYFPLFIPKSFFSKEASHVKGFAKECAIVTHYRLKENEAGDGVEVDEKSKLEEELVVRPTSETIMYDTFSRWVSSWRDLPLKINQWANIVRWERRTRPFLRTTEFLWQEGHTVHSTHEECEKEVAERVNMYATFAREYLGIETYNGRKSDSERFAGALNTYGVEAMMQDGKALQFGTSHDLGQNFSKAFNIQFTDKDGEIKNPWQTSWGTSTRMMGALIMTHSDDNGLVLPPSIAPIKIVVIPIFNDSNKDKVLNYSKELAEKLKVELDCIELDDRDFVSPGFKFNEWEKKGVPIRIEIGEREIESNNCIVVRRDTSEKISISSEVLGSEIKNTLEKIQENLFTKSKENLISKTYRLDSFDKFKEHFLNNEGFVFANWCGNVECEDAIKYETKATTRCLTHEGEGKKGTCIYCGKESNDEWVFAKAY
ncbi:MAG: proline--tRNA ligase [Candidatus Dojkabacteria bacterium]